MPFTIPDLLQVLQVACIPAVPLLFGWLEVGIMEGLTVAWSYGVWWDSRNGGILAASLGFFFPPSSEKVKFCFFCPSAEGFSFTWTLPVVFFPDVYP